jgi:hypothetical protein
LAAFGTQSGLDIVLYNFDLFDHSRIIEQIADTVGTAGSIVATHNARLFENP